MKKLRVYSNIVINIILQLSIVVSGLIIPNLIIHHYGSNINGMITSINQLLSYITLLEAGIGAVIRAELYKPLHEEDRNRLNEIYSATQKFYSKIGFAFCIYLVILAFFYNKISGETFGWKFSATMVLILGINIIVQYFIGITNLTLLQADQQLWFTSSVQIVTLWLNVVFTIILVNGNASIQVVKLATAIIFAIRPICYVIFAKRKYKIKKVKTIPQNVLSQKWDGFGHHIAYFIHTNTDVVVLTLFASLAEVSVYSVYLMVVTGVRSFLAAIASAIEPYFGRLIAINDSKEIKKKFRIYEFLYYFMSTVVFSATLMLIVPFVDIYSSGVTDALYHRPLFSILIVIAEWLYCIRSPYSMIVFASGHFKQTRNGAFVEAFINIGLSLVFVQFWGIVGVAIGTVVAMAFRTTQYVFYLRSNILNYNPKTYLVRLIEIVVSTVVLYAIIQLIHFIPTGYFQWAIMAIIVTLCAGFISLITYCLLSIDDMKLLLGIIKNKRTKKTI